MKIGFFATGSGTSGYHDLLEQVEYADASGFDSVWLRERHFHTDDQGRNYFSAPFVAAAYIAARTRHVRIGMGARILPLDHPVHIAEDGATVDVISNGRLDLGVARIGENDLYQSAFGVTNEQTRGRFFEALDIIEQAWTKDRFSYHGEHFQIDDVSVSPKPVQKPHPPIFLVGISPSTLEFGAKRGLPVMLAGAQTASVVKQTQDDYAALLTKHGHEPRSVVHPVNRFIYVAESRAQAVADTRDTIMKFMHRGNTVIREFMKMPDDQITYDLLFDQVCIFGDPDECLRKIQSLEQTIDLRSVIFSFNFYTIPHDKCRASMRRFVEHVLPRLRAGITKLASGQPVGVGL